MDLSLILSFLGASVLLTLMPGPDNLYVLTESIAKGAKTGILISLGLCSGIIIHTTAAALGLSLILERSTTAFTIMKFFGAGYLFYLAFLEFRSDAALELGQTTKTQSLNARALWSKGFFMNVLNPKVALFFIALLPQFVTENGASITLQMLLLGLIFMIQAIVIFSLISLFAGKLTPYVEGQKRQRIIKWIKIAILTVLAVSILLLKN